MLFFFYNRLEAFFDRGMGEMITKDVKEQLIQVSGPENFDDSNAGRLVYSYDATPQYQSMPDAVIAPRNTDEVSRILTICS